MSKYIFKLIFRLKFPNLHCKHQRLHNKNCLKNFFHSILSPLRILVKPDLVLVVSYVINCIHVSSEKIKKILSSFVVNIVRESPVFRNWKFFFVFLRSVLSERRNFWKKVQRQLSSEFEDYATSFSFKSAQLTAR